MVCYTAEGLHGDDVCATLFDVGNKFGGEEPSFAKLGGETDNFFGELTLFFNINLGLIEFELFGFDVKTFLNLAD